MVIFGMCEINVIYCQCVMMCISQTVQIIHNRLWPNGLYVWNHPPGGLYFHPEFNSSPLDYPFFRDYPSLALPTKDNRTRTLTNYTSVITYTKVVMRESSSLIKLVKSISSAAHLERVVFVWVGFVSPHVQLAKTVWLICLICSRSPQTQGQPPWVA